MISKVIKDMFNRPTENLMIPASDVATCNEEDTLLHAVLVLSNSGYQIIPVIDSENHVRGLISISDIVTSFDNLSLFDEEKLNAIKVKEVMNQVVPILFDNYDLEDVLRLLVNNNFVCITHKNGYFLGIIPRKVALERFTHIAHNIDSEYDLVEKVNDLV
ncbi:CBS domain-containing protein ykuL [Anaerococcus prevotii]|uniref:Transcriptional regulator, XRE family n=1 Tax=Anaerococcus prevotii (strain ATCC 9321 / DSM 20548 / JCM 6508 / NCTC 11806 / PC1) TaxID=525919 RepID=C7RH56_ANAPD|nr:cyclic-di-AMP-binding protein CbpB [Anaerococcus prevotii]ACV28817.1 putative transcriptional regulator, XRE family [Anaerococcus prevotii DSM 20548]SUU94492.1 CBS domain-containing protein ykuL [Anaerococcus prevotii]